ncbi:MAG: glycoside hydrolase [Bryobacteraceae bacterium]|nr:glycoside hydrolase [Bryobacteraceae bacterium]
MGRLRIVETGIINADDAAYPSLIRLDDGEILAAFTVGGGPQALGGTALARSCDGGRNWQTESMILSPSDSPPTTNSLRLSRTPQGTLIAYGFRKFSQNGDRSFGHRLRRDPVYTLSRDGGRVWGPVQTIPTSAGDAWEVSNPMVVLSGNRWLAPAASLFHPDRLGETALVFCSDDGGVSWPDSTIVFHDPEGVRGFFEQKIIETEPGRLLATAWTVRMGDYRDLDNHFSVSTDAGRTWSPARPTGIQGQTLTPIWLGGDRIAALYNCRYGRQGVRMCLVRYTAELWTVEWEEMLWDARASRSVKLSTSGLEELSTFAFGLPCAIRLDARHLLAAHWCVEDGVCLIRWTRLELLP